MTDEIKQPIEQVLALFDGADLSEEAKAKISTIWETAFDAAVQEKVSAVREELIEAGEAALEEAKADIRTELEGKVDEYLSYVAEEWKKDNELAVETGLRVEVTESFMEGLKQLFVEHYVEVPESKRDLVADLAEKVEEMQSSLNEQVQENIKLKKEVGAMKKAQILESKLEGLSDASRERVKALAETVDFVTEDEFTQKVSILVETFGGKSVAKPAQTDNSLLQEEGETVELREGKEAPVAKPDSVVNSVLSILPRKQA